MKGTVRNIPFNEFYGFIRANTNLDSIFFHKDDYHGDWFNLVKDVNAEKTVYMRFELGEGKRGPRASKIERISEQEFKQVE